MTFSEPGHVRRITDDPEVRQQPMYHSVNPFSPNGRYVAYKIREPDKTYMTFGLYDLLAGIEVYRHPSVARFPVWHPTEPWLYFTEGAHPTESGDLCRINADTLVIERIASDLPGPIQTIHHTGEYAYASAPLDGRGGSAPDVLWKVDLGGTADPPVEGAWCTAIGFSEGWGLSEPRCVPGTDLILARHIPPVGKRWDGDHPARVILGDFGVTLLGTLSEGDDKAWHVCASGDGALVVRSEGPLRAKRTAELPDADYGIVGTHHLLHDPSPCGASGRYLLGKTGENDVLYVVDTWPGAYTRRVCALASIIVQERGQGDQSHLYDSEVYGSPDGTTVLYATNYKGPHTRTTERILRNAEGGGPETLEVESTAGFSDVGILTVWRGLVAHTGRTDKAFTGCSWAYANTEVEDVVEAGSCVTDYLGRHRAVPLDPMNVLANQDAVDVCLVVVRKPDAPELVPTNGAISLRPGVNHREVRAYELSINGQPVSLIEVGDWTANDAVATPCGIVHRDNVLTAKAVQWSGLTSEPSNGVKVGAGVRVTLGEPQREASWEIPWAERLYHRPSGQLYMRKLYRAPGELASLETYDADGRRRIEVVYGPTGGGVEWALWKAGVPIRRGKRPRGEGKWELEELKDGVWQGR